MRLMLAALAAAAHFGGGNRVEAPAQPAPFTYTVARRGCTQEDAAALEIYLTRARYTGEGQPSEPFVRLEIAWGDGQHLRDSTLMMLPLSRHQGDAARRIVRAELHERNARGIWLEGTVRLSSIQPDRRVRGVYDLRDARGRRWRSTFDAAWIRSRGAGCG